MSGSVVTRIGALGRFADMAQGHLPDADLAPARALISRAGERLALSGEHTVVALAGSTGSGKSSIFNALAGVTLSQTGLRRPTTGEAHACVWGDDDAGALLDWLAVGRRFTRDGGHDPDLSGLVLLDLPDFDSVQASHRAEADRLLAVVDLIVWVLHPQKYADKVVHAGYLAQFHRHREITVVVLNQADLLSPDDLRECVEDLPRLLADDGLGSVPMVTTSTVAAPGLGSLTILLAKAVAARQAALRRLGADLDTVTARLAPLAGPAVSKNALGPTTTGPLTDALARAAGVPLVADATRNAYIHRARKVTGWPLLRWSRRLRADPLARLHLGGRTDAPGATSIGPAMPAAQAAVALALRATATRAAEGLPKPWEASVLAATRSHMDELPDALDRAVAGTDLGMERPRAWWRLVGVLQWIFTAAVLAGLLWLGVRYLLFALALPEPPMPEVGRLPLPTALLAGGLLGGLLVSLLVRPIVRIAAGHQRRRVLARLRSAVDRVTRDLVVAPTQRALDAYTEARKSLRQATD